MPRSVGQSVRQRQRRQAVTEILLRDLKRSEFSTAENNYLLLPARGLGLMKITSA